MKTFLIIPDGMPLEPMEFEDMADAEQYADDKYPDAVCIIYEIVVPKPYV